MKISPDHLRRVVVFENATDDDLQLILKSCFFISAPLKTNTGLRSIPQNRRRRNKKPV